MMRRRDFVLALGTAPLTGCLSTRESSRGKEACHRMEVLVPELMARANVPGSAVACVRNGRLLWSGAFGYKSALSKVPVDQDTLFEAASVSKTVFAYAVLKLAERGVIDLDAPLVRYTPAPFIRDDSRIERVTARNLLAHSSGFAEWRSSSAPLFQSEPDVSFQYSGEGYYYLQSVLTHLVGKVDPSQCSTYEADFEVCATDFDDFMKRDLLRPFGMRLSTYLPGPNWERVIAHGHDSVGQLHSKRPPTRPDVARYGSLGGLHTTAVEYARFLVELVAPRKGDRFRLSESMRQEMFRPHIALPKGGEIDGCTAWGLGWGIQQRPEGNLLVHSGGQTGFRSLALASVRHQSGLIILTNSDNGGKVIYDPGFLQLADRILTSPA
jgi:CubicO group peptidase (beta-lactamase class C family)